MKISDNHKDQILIALGAIFANLISALNDFHNDDWMVLTTLRDGFSWKVFLSTETFRYFRPLTNIVVYLRYLAFGSSPLGYHIVNILLHAAVCILLYRLLIKMKFPRVAAVTSSLFFAAYFQHYEAVIWIYGIIRIMVALFWLLSLIALYKYVDNGRRKALAIFSIVFFLGLFVCEDFIIAPIVFVAFIILAADKTKLWKRLLPVILCSSAGLALYFILRLSLIHYSPVSPDIYFIGPHIFQKFIEYLSWMVIPSPDHEYFRGFAIGLGPWLYWTWKITAWSSGVLMILGPVYLLAKFPNAIKFFVLFILFTLLPAMPFTFKISSRYIYIPSIGLAVITGYLFYLLLGKMSSSRLLRLLFIGTFGLFLIIHVAGIAITSLEFHKTDRLVKGMIADVRDSGIDLPRYQYVLLDDLPGRAAPGQVLWYYFGFNIIIASNDVIYGPIDISKAADDLISEGKSIVVFDYRNGHLKEVTREYVNHVRDIQ
jgi:hypothetical protein